MFIHNGDVVVLVTIYTVNMGCLQVKISTLLYLHRNDCLLGPESVREIDVHTMYNQ